MEPNTTMLLSLINDVALSYSKVTADDRNDSFYIPHPFVSTLA